MDIVNKGFVVSVEGDMARVRTARAEACAMCAAKGFCHPLGEKENEIVLKNTIGARQGQEVVLIMRSSSMVSASMFLYLLPLSFVIALALIGYSIGEKTGYTTPDLGLLVGVGIGLIVSFFIGKRLAKRIERSRAFEVRMDWPDSVSGDDSIKTCSGQ